jgi:hypothetical protein
MTFKSKETPGLTHEILMLPNSCVIIGMDTNKKWYHEVKPINKLINLNDKTNERMSLTFRSVGTFHNLITNELSGLGAPNYLENKWKDDKLDMIKAFSEENKNHNFDRNNYYNNGFYSFST